MNSETCSPERQQKAATLMQAIESISSVIEHIKTINRQILDEDALPEGQDRVSNRASLINVLDEGPQIIGMQCDEAHKILDEIHQYLF